MDLANHPNRALPLLAGGGDDVTCGLALLMDVFPKLGSQEAAVRPI